jgi:hypothetical protein
LLAPAEAAAGALRQARGTPAETLAARFGLPAGAARAYAEQLVPPVPSDALLRRLGLGDVLDLSHSASPARKSD